MVSDGSHRPVQVIILRIRSSHSFLNKPKKYVELVHIDPVLLLTHVILELLPHALFLGLFPQLLLVELLVEGLFFGPEHAGDELVAELFGVDLVLDGSLDGELPHLAVQHLLYLLFVHHLLGLLHSGSLVLGA